MKIELDFDSFCDAKYLASGVFAPLDGFMNEADFKSVCASSFLANEAGASRGGVWTIPITLEKPKDFKGYEAQLVYEGKSVGFIDISDEFEAKDDDIFAVFGTNDKNHPGVKKELNKNKIRLAGKPQIEEKFLENDLYKGILKNKLELKENSKICGFQTRNPIHKAHEHLQRTALEICDYLFINPLIGWKKPGDFAPEAIFAAYSTMIEKFYPKNRVYFAPLITQMRYAGPKEAVFHALIRKNLGCSHFIIGRDHAGVGEYYGVYEAQEFAKKFADKLGIELLLLSEPYYCEFCGQITSANACCHDEAQKIKISGTKIRECLKSGKIPPAIMMRKEISAAILSLPKEQILIS